MKWSSGMIGELANVVDYFKRGGMGKTLEILADYFIERMKKKARIETYAMEFHHENLDVDSERIGQGEYKLAFICHLVNLRKNNRKKSENKSEKNMKKERKEKNVYECLSVMIKYCIMKILKYKEKRDYRIYFLSYIIKENLIPEHKIDEKDDKILEIITLAYYLTDELIKITNSDETHKFEEFRNEKDSEIGKNNMNENMNSIYENRSLISHCENLDISICSRKQIRELYSILGTKRTIFVRILLVLAFEIIHRKSSINKSWLNRFVKFKNKKEFLTLMHSPLVEVFLFITSERIKFLNVTESF
jgi:hypothetical protein